MTRVTTKTQTVICDKFVHATGEKIEKGETRVGMEAYIVSHPSIRAATAPACAHSEGFIESMRWEIFECPARPLSCTGDERTGRTDDHGVAEAFCIR